MKKLILMGIAAMFCSGAFANDSETNNLYAEVFVGPNFLQTETHQGVKPNFNVGYIVSGSFGYHLRYGLSLEAEYAFRRNSLSNLFFYGQNFDIAGHFQSSSFMANLICDFSFCNWGCSLGKFHPLLGGGVGYDLQQFRAKDEAFSMNEKKQGFAWQLIAGVSYSFSRHSEIGLEYKFHEGPINNIFSHALVVGYAYKFCLSSGKK